MTIGIEIFGNLIPVWQVYAALGIFLMCLEIVIPGFVMIPIGFAFVSTSLFTLLVDSPAWHLAFLAANLFATIYLSQKYLVKRFSKDHLLTNADAMIGKKATVSDTILGDGSAGYVRLYGDEWRALSSSGENLEKGTAVIICSLEGNKVTVKKAN